MYVLLLFTVTLHPISSPSLELISLSIQLSFVSVFFIVHLMYFDTLCAYLVSICANTSHNLILLGDFNVNFDNVSRHLYCDLCNLSTLSNCGTNHIHHNGSHCTIDLVFISNQIKVGSCDSSIIVQLRPLWCADAN